MKNFIKDLLLGIAGIASLYIAKMTGTGEILNYIHFSDPLNEMFFCITALMLGSGCIVAAISKA